MNTAKIMSRINLFRRQSNLTKKSYFHSTSISLKPKISVAIVGSGPSACYTAKYLTSTLQQQSKKGLLTGTNINDLETLHIDVIEKLPTPFGLVVSAIPTAQVCFDSSHGYAKALSITNGRLYVDLCLCVLLFCA